MLDRSELGKVSFARWAARFARRIEPSPTHENVPKTFSAILTNHASDESRGTSEVHHRHYLMRRELGGPSAAAQSKMSAGFGLKLNGLIEITHGSVAARAINS
jgi:hypothetical protein